jgi:hypothetical protein
MDAIQLRRATLVVALAASALVSPAGYRFAERLLTVIASCRQQGRRLLDFLVAAGEAALRGTAAPSLLPTSQPVILQARRQKARMDSPACPPPHTELTDAPWLLIAVLIVPPRARGRRPPCL